jgi:Rieske Fe-S protein
MQTFFLSTSTLQSDQKENKSRVLPHLLIYRNVCHHLGCPYNYASYAQSFYWLPTSQKIY